MTADVVSAVLGELRSAGVAERRERADGYHPTSMEVFGVPVPAARQVVRRLTRRFRSEPPKKVLTVARALLDTHVHEARQVAFELVGGRPDVIGELDGRGVESLGRGNDNWGSVDCLAVFVSGPAWRDGGVRDRDVLRWARSGDRWWRRTALVSTVPLNQRSRGGSGDPARTLRVCAELVADRDPMVAKASSWALRALAVVHPDSVRAFLQQHGDDVPALVRREVANKLDTGLKAGKRRR